MWRLQLTLGSRFSLKGTISKYETIGLVEERANRKKPISRYQKYIIQTERYVSGPKENLRKFRRKPTPS